jgi:hypothetical protein
MILEKIKVFLCSNHTKILLLAFTLVLIFTFDIYSSFNRNIDNIRLMHQKTEIQHISANVEVANVVVDTFNPMVISGVKKVGLDNYLEWTEVVLQNEQQRVRLIIQGSVLGEKESCIGPRITFWSDNQYLKDTSTHYFLSSGDFQVDFVTEYPENTTKLSPRITFSQGCFNEKQRIRLDNVFIEMAP